MGEIFRGTPREIETLHIGATLYSFDGNRRVYDKKFRSAPIYEKHFRAENIVGETKVSWLVGPSSVKVNKRTLSSATHFADRGYFTQSAMEADIWLHVNRRKIVREVESASFEQLKEIARIVGYEAN